MADRHMYILAMYMLEGPYFPVGNRDLPAHTESSGTSYAFSSFLNTVSKIPPF